MTLTHWKTIWTALKRTAAALPAAGAVLGVAMAAGSSVRPDVDRTAEAVARATGGDLSADGMDAIQRRLTPSQLALAQRHDPGLLKQAMFTKDAPIMTAGALRPARPFVFQGTAEDRRRALRCLTQAVYFEAALEPDAGQAAVAQVVLNRVRDPNYADTVCGVVFEGAERITGCQFSFTCDGSLSQAPVAWAWERARKVAEKALNGEVARDVGTATHYHADYVNPWWSPTVARVTKIGAHVFYRWKGIYGETAAFRAVYKGHEPRIDEARFSRPRPGVQPGQATGGADPDAAVEIADATPLKTVEIDGQTRVVGVASLGGRRLPTHDEVAAINARLQALEPAKPTSLATETAPEGVVSMPVEEVGRPSN